MKKCPFISFSSGPKTSWKKGGRTPDPQTAEDSELAKQCPACGSRIPLSVIWEQANTCTCGYHFRMNARQRIQFLTDPGSFQERDARLTAADALAFPGLPEKGWPPPGSPAGNRRGVHLRHREDRRPVLRPVCHGAPTL